MKDNYHIRDTGRYSLGADLTGVENQTKHDYNQEHYCSEHFLKHQLALDTVEL